MEQSMFDRLGDLLSEVLETGELPRPERETILPHKGNSPEQEEAAPPRVIPGQVRAALNFIAIPEGAGFDEAKKIYREKLMYYHPDRRNGNPVLQKVAKEKTERLIKNWECVEKWYKSET